MSVFKNEYTRVSKIDEPFLIIGLGGSGLDGLLHIKDLFSERMEMAVDFRGNKLNHPPRMAYLEIDTDDTALQKSYNGTRLEISEFIDLADKNLMAKLEMPAAFLEPYQREWLDELYTRTFINGAGGIRQAGRLMLMLKAQEVYNQLVSRITEIMSVDAGAAAPDNHVTIVIISGLSGGTGSGTFLDIPYMIRHIMAAHFAACQYDISGYLVMPDVHIAMAAHGNPILRHRFESNGFAALKELDYWMGEGGHRHPFRQQYTDTVMVDWSNMRPYDGVTLLSATRADGSIISNPGETVYKLLAETLLHYTSYVPAPVHDFELNYYGHRANFAAEIHCMPKPYPVNYCYTAMGAASTRPQQDQMIDYEASLLMEKMAALADNQPNPASTEAEDFAREVLHLEGTYDRAKSQAPLPEWAREKATHNDAETMRDGGSGYHVVTENGELYNWQRRVAVPQMKAFFFGDPNDENMHGKLRDIWRRFIDKAREIIHNRLKGPYYLEALLDGEHGVIGQVEKQLAAANAAKGTLDAEIAHLYDSAEQELRNTRNAGFLTKGIEILNIGASPFGRYIDHCAVLYESVRKRAYVEQLAAMLEELKNWLQGYLDNSLRIYNRTMIELNSALGSSVGEAGGMMNFVAPFARLRVSIDERFEEVNVDDAMLSHMLDLIAERSLTYVGGDDARPVERRCFEKDIEHFVNETFRSLNNISLDEMLTMAVGDDPAQRVNDVAHRWAPQLDAAAVPLFPSLASMANDSVVPFEYVAVPDNAIDFRTGIHQYAMNRDIRVAMHRSGIRERVAWINSYIGLPLCRYADLEGMEASYERAMNGPSGMGIHLVGGDMPINWKDLPSPIPHELLKIAMSPRLVEKHNEAMAALNGAIDAGMLTISRTEPSYELRFLTVNGAEPSSYDFDNMLNKLKAGDDDAANAERLDYWAKKPDAIDALIVNAALPRQTVAGEYKKFAGAHDFTAYDYEHQPDESQAKRNAVDNNIALLNKDLVLYTLSKQPYTIARIERQLDFFGKLNDYRMACAEKMAKL